MALRGTNQEFGRPYNRRIVLETIRLMGPISRADIARRVALSPQTVSNIIRDLEDEGLLLARRQRPTRRGQPAIELAINPKGGFAIGLQLAADRLSGVLVNLAGEVCRRADRSLADARPERAFPAMAEMVERLSSAASGADRTDALWGLGLVMPGPFDVEIMSFVGPTTLNGWEGVPIAERLKALVGLPVFLGIDATAAGLGERLYGAGRHMRDFFYIYFGVGLGGGAILDGHAHRGAWGNAGEFGHFPVVPGGRPCPCGNRGCLEQYVSLLDLHRALAAAGHDPKRADWSALLDAGDPALTAWIEQAVDPLRRAICAVENLLDPEAIVIGGKLPEPVLDRLFAELQPLLPSVSQRTGRATPRLVKSELGADSALLGAAVLAISEMMAPRFGLLFAEGTTGRGASGRAADHWRARDLAVGGAP